MLRARHHAVGVWSADEHQLFLAGLHKYGKNWEEIQKTVWVLSVRYLQIPTRTVCQVRTHAQKYFSKLEKDVICVAARVDRVETKGCFVWQPLVRVSVFVSE